MNSTPTPYVHGYDPQECRRLQDQADALVDRLHGDTRYPPGSRVLEVGCGVGAQTVILATRSPGAHFTAIDVSAESLAVARQRCEQAGLTNVTFRQSDLFALAFDEASFDHVFICFVLEHLSKPVEALQRLRRLVSVGGTITAIEGDHGSVLMHPESVEAMAAVRCLVMLQNRAGGNALVGRQLYPLLTAAGLGQVDVASRVVLVDGSRPALADGFTRHTFTAMVEGVREAAIAAELTTPQQFDAGIEGLLRTTQADGVFCYTFFKAVGLNPYPPG